MPLPRQPRQSHGWRSIACFAVLGLTALWTLSRAPRFEARHEAVANAQPHAVDHGGFPDFNVKDSIVQESVVTPTSRFRLLLSTHSRLFWYYPDTQEDVAVHKGQGVYYGTFPGEPAGSESTVWVVSRPHNWRPSSQTERLLNINTNSGQLINSVQIPSRFSHDAVKSGDHIWVCNTGHGQLLQLSYPSMDVIRTLDLFTVKEHINTVAVFDSSSVWVVLHNLGRSAVVKVDLASGQVAQRYDNVGSNCHGLVMWRGLFVLLSSKETSLITLNPSTREVTYIWSRGVQAEQGFLKGLAVVDDVAYFGISPPMERQNRDGPNVECDVVAVDLLTHQQVFRHVVATHGLLNIVSSPELSEASSYIAQRTPWGPPLRPDVPVVNQVALRTSVADLTTFQGGQTDLVDSTGQLSAFQAGQMGLSDRTAQVTTMQTDQTGVTDGAGLDALTTGGDSTALSTANGETPIRWSESWLERPIDASAASSKWLTTMPRMDLQVKLQALGSPHTLGRRAAVNNLPVYLPLGKVAPELIRPAQARLAEMPSIWWDPPEQATVSAVIADREDNLEKIKPGVRTMFLIFSSRTTDIVWELPLYHYYQSVLDPILEALLGKNAMKNIIRLQLAQMNAGAHIKPHRDTGPWAQTSHRIHVVLKTNPTISFFSCPNCGSSRDAGFDSNCRPPPEGGCIPVETELDNVFEINNLMIHEVLNTASEDRVHMVVDVLEEPAPERRVLQPGQQCHYVSSMKQANNPGC